MRIENEIKLDFDSVLIKPKRSTLKSRSEVTITREFTFKHSGRKFNGIPIVAANMDTVGTIEMAIALGEFGMLTALHKHYDEKKLFEFFEKISDKMNESIFYSMGITEADKEKYENICENLEINQRPYFVCIDVPSAYLESVVDFVKKFRDNNLEVVLMVGNVCTSEMTEALILAGADIVKVGIGSGASCLTRQVAGVGIPQLSAIIESADAAHGLSGHICSDGGITCPGDLCKAFGAGSDFVMVGSVFAGHDEGLGNVIIKKDEKYVEFYGMSSKKANEKYSGGMKDYRAAEGRELLIPYKGSIDKTVLEYLGGLRSCLTYTGSRKLKELSKRTTFIRVDNQLNTSLIDNYK